MGERSLAASRQTSGADVHARYPASANPVAAIRNARARLHHIE